MPYRKKHSGVIVPMVTPFTKELTLDTRATEQMVDRLARHGLGVFVMGTTGEAASIPNNMRSKLVEIASKVAKGRVPVYAGIGDNCVLDSIESAKDYLKLGADAVVAPLPAYYLLDPSEMLEYFELIASQVNGPIVPYNIPQATHMSIPVEVIARLSERDNIVGFKDSENKPGRIEQVAKLGQRPDFSIFMGVARQSLAALQLGFDGLVPSSGNLVPEAWRGLVNLFENADIAGAEELQTRLDQIATIFQDNRTLGQSLASLKSCMNALGQCQNHVLPPLRTEPPSQIARYRELLGQCDIIPTPSPS